MLFYNKQNDFKVFIMRSEKMLAKILIELAELTKLKQELLLSNALLRERLDLINLLLIKLVPGYFTYSQNEYINHQIELEFYNNVVQEIMDAIDRMDPDDAQVSESESVPRLV